ncbi:signal recognition particle protein [bacterium]|nr:signal recognition particle protein [bacterium]
MFDELVQKLDIAVKNLRGMGKITEKNVAESMREIRRVLLEADVNYKVAKSFINAVQEKALGEEVLRSVTPGQQVVKIVHSEMIRLLGQSQSALKLDGMPPAVIMIVGLQGSGKTTFAGKLGKYLKKKGRFPMLVAADVVRPAAIDQLHTVGKQGDIPVFSMGQVDPVEIAKSGIKEARQKGCDVMIVDTAGRLHIDTAMMDELDAVKAAIKPSEILFVADGMTGQDAVKSAQVFLDKLDFDGIVLTKLDGDAKGGAALSIRSVTGKPIKFISAGERLDDLESFHPDRMASRILGMGDILTLVERAQETSGADDADKMARKLRKQEFTFDDFLAQIQQVKKMGPLSQVAGLMPGMNKLKGVDVDDRALVPIEAIISSMTFGERRKPNIINGSRRKRIAMGSGTSVQEVNRLLKQFKMMQKMVKQMSRMGGRRMPKGLPMGF